MPMELSLCLLVVVLAEAVTVLALEMMLTLLEIRVAFVVKLEVIVVAKVWLAEDAFVLKGVQSRVLLVLIVAAPVVAVDKLVVDLMIMVAVAVVIAVAVGVETVVVLVVVVAVEVSVAL